MDLEEGLRVYFGHSAFRPGQREVVQACLSGRDSVVVMPTGAGKSVCFQLPALVSKRPVIVVSPLIALMDDQVIALNAKGIAAVAVNSSTGVFLDAVLYSKHLLVYISPEALENESNLEVLEELQRRRGICSFAIDEAHCISEWGNEFRPAYRALGLLKQKFREVPIIATTATATHETAEQIIKSLGLVNPLKIRSSFDRPNLFYDIRLSKGLENDLTKKLFDVDGSSIVYCLTKKVAEDVAKHLNSIGVYSRLYHAGMQNEDRREAYRLFSRDLVKCIVATVAFGMGINKLDIRLVVLYGASKNIEDFYQQTGRAGRDGEKSQCVMFYSPKDFQTHQTLFSLGFFPKHVQALKALNEKMRALVNYNRCRRKLILEYFGEVYAQTKCGNCDFCIAQSSETNLERDYTAEARLFALAVYETGERFGFKVPIFVLRGENTKLLEEKSNLFRVKNISSMKSFGVLKKPTQWLSEFAHMLFSVNVLMKKPKAGRCYNRFAGDTYCLGDLGLRLLRDSSYCLPKLACTRTLAAISETSENLKTRTRSGTLLKEGQWAPKLYRSSENLSDTQGLDLAVYKGLAALRKEISQVVDISPAMVMSDLTLRSLTHLRPKSISELPSIPGLTQFQIEKYGSRIVACVLQNITSVVASQKQEEDSTLFQQFDTVPSSSNLVENSQSVFEFDEISDDALEEIMSAYDLPEQESVSSDPLSQKLSAPIPVTIQSKPKPTDLQTRKVRGNPQLANFAQFMSDDRVKSISDVCSLRKLRRVKAESLIQDCLLSGYDINLSKIVSLRPEEIEASFTRFKDVNLSASTVLKEVGLPISDSDFKFLKAAYLGKS